MSPPIKDLLRAILYILAPFSRDLNQCCGSGPMFTGSGPADPVFKKPDQVNPQTLDSGSGKPKNSGSGSVSGNATLPKKKTLSLCKENHFPQKAVSGPIFTGSGSADPVVNKPDMH